MQRATVAADRRSATRWAAGSAGGRLARFVLERFPPVAYGTLIVALVLCATAGATLDRGGGPVQVGWSQAWAAVAAWLAFLQLRALDELRDEASDMIGRPDRPLPRGLVSRRELRILAVGAAIAGVSVATALGPSVLAWYGLALGQVWLLDVAAGRRLVPGGMVASALMHSGIVPTVLLFAWAVTDPPEAGVPLTTTLLLVWGAGLALEVGRKTLSVGEERPGIETYSAALGRTRALALAASFLGLTGIGSALLALSVDAPVPIAVTPLVVAVVAAAPLVAGGDRVSTRAVRTGVPLVILAALLWPVALAWGLQ